MPRDTFLNLPADKRARFVDAALDEFAAHPFDQASITAIVARLGIAKGSVYQYFDDKVDLFGWLVEEAGRRKLAALVSDGEAPVPAGTFFERLRGMYLSGLRFWQREPKWARLGARLLEPSQEPRIDALRRASLDASRAWLGGELRAARDAGHLRPVDLDAATSLVHAVLTEGVLQSLLARAGLDRIDAPDASERLLGVSPAALAEVTDTAVSLLERGLAASPAKTLAARLAAAQLEAYNAADLDAFCACYHDDVTVLGPDEAPSLTGMCAFRERYGRLFADFDDVGAEVTERLALGTHVVDRERWWRRDRASGARTQGEVLVRYTEQDGKLRWVEFLR